MTYESDSAASGTLDRPVSRRDALKKAAVGAGVAAWSAPAVQAISQIPAFGQASCSCGSSGTTLFNHTASGAGALGELCFTICTSGTTAQCGGFSCGTCSCTNSPSTGIACAVGNPCAKAKSLQQSGKIQITARNCTWRNNTIRYTSTFFWDWCDVINTTLNTAVSAAGAIALNSLQSCIGPTTFTICPPANTSTMTYVSHTNPTYTLPNPPTGTSGVGGQLLAGTPTVVGGNLQVVIQRLSWNLHTSAGAISGCSGAGPSFSNASWVIGTTGTTGTRYATSGCGVQADVVFDVTVSGSAPAGTIVLKTPQISFTSVNFANTSFGGAIVALTGGNCGPCGSNVTRLSGTNCGGGTPVTDLASTQVLGQTCP
jgi:hypothetical protein